MHNSAQHVLVLDISYLNEYFLMNKLLKRKNLSLSNLTISMIGIKT